jgi:sigma-B regulation protein RsbU (phosphoserine phosphatase)
MPVQLSEHKVRVLLVDDQPLIGEAVRRLVAGEPDIEYHYCRDPLQAQDKALELRPTVILQDLVMPGIDGLELIRRFRADDRTRDVPMVMLSTNEEGSTKADAFALGANDYIVKLPDRLELLARIRHHSRGYINQLQRDEAFRALRESQETLARDVDEAAKYVRSLLPGPITKGPIRAEWRFIPSTALGGDTFGYHELDDDHFAFYLIDVVGHGVGPALLSVSVLNTIRSEALPETDFHDPGQVLTSLNRVFEMSAQGDKYFTAWYGVYDAAEKTIRYSGGGHPPALLIPDGSTEAVSLEATGPMVGAFDDLEFSTETLAVEGPCRLYLYSDGAFEIQLKTDGSMWPFRDFVSALCRPPAGGKSCLDDLIEHARELSGKEGFEDDFSAVEFRFGG